ncbi:MAG: signal peptide peptidase SppA [Pseudomonadota bacterium]
MFSRRHPFLFFFLVLASLFTSAFIALVAVIMGSSSLLSSSLTDDLVSKGNIGIIELTGIILSSKETLEAINDFRENEDIKAIVLRIDSPGGGVAPSQEIYRAIVKTRQSKKVIASLGAVAASGGYYAAAASDGIMASPGTLTGSIGVIMEYANIREIMEKIGLAPVVIKSGEFKDMGSPVRELTDKERQIFQGIANEIHAQFVQDVATGRNLDRKTVESLADGRVYTGQTAVDLNLIDRLGNMDDAISWAAEIAGIQGTVKPVYPRQDKITFLKKMVGSLFKEAYISGTLPEYFRFIVN